MAKALNSLEIFEYLKKDEFSKRIFKQVLARDQLPQKVNYPSAYIINTHKISQKGEHWLAVYYDENGNCEFFDSFGQSPKFYNFEKFLIKTSRKWSFNTTRLQSFLSMTCGYYCLYFILMKCRQLGMNEIIRHFTKNYKNNDYKISFLLI
jgi:hypothetical protein